MNFNDGILNVYRYWNGWSAVLAIRNTPGSDDRIFFIAGNAMSYLEKNVDCHVSLLVVTRQKTTLTCLSGQNQAKFM